MEHVEDKLFMRVLTELTEKGALLDLFLGIREGLVGELVVCGYLCHSDHKLTEFQTIVNRRKTASKTSTLDMGRAESSLPKELISKVPCF